MILDQIIASTRIRVEKAKEKIPFSKLEEQVNVYLEKQTQGVNTSFPFERAMKTPGISFICEVKRASPSKGLISEDFPYIQIAREYEEGGASAISVLTEPEYFLGNDQYLQEIREVVTLPILRKDFTIDPYQIYEATLLGANAILLICSVLSDKELEDMIGLCNYLGVSALVEAHTEEEIQRGIAVGARIIGMNNRDLRTFKVDLNRSLIYRKLVPDSILYIAESGISSYEDIRALEQAGVDGVLIGETLVRYENRKDGLFALRGGHHE